MGGCCSGTSASRGGGPGSTPFSPLPHLISHSCPSSFLLSPLPPLQSPPLVSALASSAVACRGSLAQAASTPSSTNQPHLVRILSLSLLCTHAQFHMIVFLGQHLHFWGWRRWRWAPFMLLTLAPFSSGVSKAWFRSRGLRLVNGCCSFWIRSGSEKV